MKILNILNSNLAPHQGVASKFGERRHIGAVQQLATLLPIQTPTINKRTLVAVDVQILEIAQISLTHSTLVGIAFAVLKVLKTAIKAPPLHLSVVHPYRTLLLQGGV